MRTDTFHELTWAAFSIVKLFILKTGIQRVVIITGLAMCCVVFLRHLVYNRIYPRDCLLTQQRYYLFVSCSPKQKYFSDSKRILSFLISVQFNVKHYISSLSVLNKNKIKTLNKLKNHRLICHSLRLRGYVNIFNVFSRTWLTWFTMFKLFSNTFITPTSPNCWILCPGLWGF